MLAAQHVDQNPYTTHYACALLYQKELEVIRVKINKIMAFSC